MGPYGEPDIHIEPPNNLDLLQETSHTTALNEEQFFIIVSGEGKVVDARYEVYLPDIISNDQLGYSEDG